MRCACASLLLLAACGSDPEPAFPADYPVTFDEVRDCRGSADHDLHNIRILADPLAFGPYADRDAPFLDGAIVLKEEYDFADATCDGPLLGWSVMVREADAWRFQKVDADRAVVSEDDPRCLGCHDDCGVPPDGYEGTCSIP